MYGDGKSATPPRELWTPGAGAHALASGARRARGRGNALADVLLSTLKIDKKELIAEAYVDLLARQGKVSNP